MNYAKGIKSMRVQESKIPNETKISTLFLLETNKVTLFLLRIVDTTDK